MKLRLLTALGVLALLIGTGCSREVAPPGVVPVSQRGQVDPPALPPGNLLVEVTEPAVPEELRNWAASVQMEKAPAYHVVREGDYAYVGVTGGLKRSGGFRVAVARWSVHQEGQKRILEVGFAVVPPPPGVGVTAALTNPVAFYRIAGDVEVRVTVSGG